MSNTADTRGTYRAELRQLSGKTTPMLLAPAGDVVAVFINEADATWVADRLNTCNENVDALARAAWLISQALAAIDSAPGRNVGAISTGPGGGK